MPHRIETIVDSHPTPIAFKRGWVTIHATAPSVLRTRFDRATPAAGRPGTYSVRVTVVTFWTSMLPTAKKKLATKDTGMTRSAVHPDTRMAAGKSSAADQTLSPRASCGLGSGFWSALKRPAAIAFRTMTRSVQRPPSVAARTLPAALGR